MDLDTCGLRKGTACVICFERVGDHVLLPCGHGGYCGTCASSVFSGPAPTRLCPLCRAELTKVVQVQLSTPIGAAVEVSDESSQARAVSSIESRTAHFVAPRLEDGATGNDDASVAAATAHFLPPDLE